ncbi:MAG: hypothetical protein RMI56_07185 [Sulfolobales archaeon]|nr:hypothetical protein [Sulfolobales archaeon]MDW8083550.1 hypothetical protein [Sulfolobales archaeon]
MSEEREEGGEVREEVEVSEALEEAPAGFVIDINGLESMIKISDLLYEAAHSNDPSKYIEEIRKLSTSTTTGEKRKKERKTPKKKTSKETKPAVKKKKKSK